MTNTWTLAFPYRRSTGPVIGTFLRGLAERRVTGIRTASGRVLVPPFEYDPETGDATSSFVDIGDTGVVVHHAWCAAPQRNHVFDRPFAWVLVRLDGADTPLLHVLDADSPEQVTSGMRVRIRWRESREGKITDIECFERIGANS